MHDHLICSNLLDGQRICSLHPPLQRFSQPILSKVDWNIYRFYLGITVNMVKVNVKIPVTDIEEQLSSM